MYGKWLTQTPNTDRCTLSLFDCNATEHHVNRVPDRKKLSEQYVPVEDYHHDGTKHIGN